MVLNSICRWNVARPAGMPSWFAIVLASIVASSAVADDLVFPEVQHGKGELRHVHGLPVAIFAGTPEEIGEQHAALLAKPGMPLLRFPKEFITQGGYDSYWPLIVQASKTLLQQTPERYQREMASASKNADFDIDGIGVSNTLLELRRLGCSTLIVQPERSATGGPLFGRNFDFPTLGLLDKYSLVMVFRPDGLHAFAAVGFPGLFGVFSGMNDVGLAVATLDVYQAADGSPRFESTGVPLAFVFRQILEECATIDDAEKLLRNTKATTRMNLAVCDRSGGAVFEITPTNVARREPNDSILPCTNHFRTEGLAVDRPCWRYDRLQKAAEETQLGVDDVKRYLHLANQGELTLQTMVFEPRPLVLHLALGRPPTSALPLLRLELEPLLLGKPPGKTEAISGLPTATSSAAEH